MLENRENNENIELNNGQHRELNEESNFFVKTKRHCEVIVDLTEF